MHWITYVQFSLMHRKILVSDLPKSCQKVSYRLLTELSLIFSLSDKSLDWGFLINFISCLFLRIFPSFFCFPLTNMNYVYPILNFDSATGNPWPRIDVDLFIILFYDFLRGIWNMCGKLRQFKHLFLYLCPFYFSILFSIYS